MSDHTDDSPRERYEGPMASAAKADTRDCEACAGTGFMDARHSYRFCPTCEGTGTAPNGNSPENPESSYIKPALGLGASGLPLDQAAALTLARATIAEQAAEIERLKHDIDALKFDTGTLTTERDTLRASVDYLKGERDTLRSALEIAGRRSDSQNASIAYFEQESASHDAALAEVTADRDTLRLEVQRLKDLNFEAQDRYAALEAERDELRENTVPGLEEECDGLRAAIGLREYQAKEATTAAKAHAEKLEAVIEALRYELAGVVHCHAATVRSIVRLANAGLELPEVEPHD